MTAAPVGLIAGYGRFPVELARSARARGSRVVAVAFRDLADPALAAEVDACAVLPLGQVERLVATFREAGVTDLVLAGKVSKTFLYQNARRLEPDAKARAILASMVDRRDDSVLGVIADALAAEGFRLLEQAALSPDLVAPEGVLGAVVPEASALADVAFAWPVARTLGELDIGQTVVVERGAVLALEAIEGTDAAIRRGCALGTGGVTVVKIAKPHQDPRFDVPAVGVDTVRALAEGKGGVLLALEAGRTLLLERAAMLAEADAAGIAVLGVDASRLPGKERGA